MDLSLMQASCWKDFIGQFLIHLNSVGHIWDTLHNEIHPWVEKPSLVIIFYKKNPIQLCHKLYSYQMNFGCYFVHYIT
jgi:hypothetical protein